MINDFWRQQHVKNILNTQSKIYEINFPDLRHVYVSFYFQIFFTFNFIFLFISIHVFSFSYCISNQQRALSHSIFSFNQMFYFHYYRYSIIHTCIVHQWNMFQSSINKQNINEWSFDFVIPMNKVNIEIVFLLVHRSTTNNLFRLLLLRNYLVSQLLQMFKPNDQSIYIIYVRIKIEKHNYLCSRLQWTQLQWTIAQ